MTITGVMVAGAVVGAGNEALFGELGSALITGSLGLVGLLVMSDTRRKLRDANDEIKEATAKIHRLQRALRKNHPHEGEDDGD